MEWFPNKLRFFFDEMYTSWAIFDSNENITSMHRIRFQLGLGGSSYEDEIPKNFSELHWKCPALILDYFRVYEMLKVGEKCEHYENNSKSTDLNVEKLFIDSTCEELLRNVQDPEYRIEPEP